MSERTHAKAIVAREPSRRPGKTEQTKRSSHAAKPAGLSSVYEVLGAPGESLDGQTLRHMQGRFGFDFSRVRVHTDTAAGESARRLNAAAYTVGRHVVFGRSQFAPGNADGQRLLAHELTHVVQQRHAGEIRSGDEIEAGAVEDGFEREARHQAAQVGAPSVAPAATTGLYRPRLQRSILGSFFSDLFSLSPGPFKAIGRAFGSESYSNEELQKYLKFLATAKRIEDHYDSDNKARAVVKQWTQQKPGFSLTAPIKILLIREMQSGHVSGADEQGILSILRGSDDQDLKQIFGAGGIDPKKLDADLSGDAAKTLHAFYEQHFEGGLKAVQGGGKELIEHIQAPYNKANLDAVIDQRVRRIQAAIAAVPHVSQGPQKTGEDLEDALMQPRTDAGNAAASINAEDLSVELAKLNIDDRNQAVQEISAKRASNDILFRDLNDNQGEPTDPAKKESWQTRTFTAAGAVRMLDQVAESANKDIAIAAPDQRKDFEKLTTPLDAAKKKAAQEAIQPVTRQSVADAASGTVKPKGKFIPGVLPGESLNYLQQIQERTPKLIDEQYQDLVVGRGEKEHSDPKLTHRLAEMELIAKAGQVETDAVFKSFIPGGQGRPLPADKFDAAGKLKTEGKIHDAWQSEQSQLKKDPDHQRESARFWMFYLMQNDSAAEGIEAINYKHLASPEFDDTTPLNAEAKSIAKVANHFIAIDAKRLFEIGRGWPAFNTGHGNISLQLFKDPDAKKDRAFLWEQFATVIHEYLHSLANRKYNDFADAKGGENTTEGNTLIEGVDSLLTETVWTRAKPRASLPEVRKRVEPEAFNAGEPFDASLLPKIEDIRYDTFPNAVKLVSVVGTRNLYAAYFYGDVKLIGGR
jgi:Domain of unknown function (DUF4157)